MLNSKQAQFSNYKQEINKYIIALICISQCPTSIHM